MSAKVPLAASVVLCDGATSGRMPADRAYEIIRVLLERGYSVRRVDSLEGARAGRLPAIAVFDRRPDVLPPDLAARASSLVDAGNASPVEVADQVDRAARPNGHARPAWKPWFPVIDSGSLHQLHAVPELLPVRRLRRHFRRARLRSSIRANCKTDCPACSRVCPEVAIVFPKYRSGPDQRRRSECRRRSPRGDEDRCLLLAGRRHLLDAPRPQRSRAQYRDSPRSATTIGHSRRRQRCLARLQQEVRIWISRPKSWLPCPRPTRSAKRPRRPSEKLKRPWRSSRKTLERT